MDVLNTREAAAYVRLGKPTLERFRVSGGGPRYCKLGGAVRYRREDLDAWLESRLITSTSEKSGKRFFTTLPIEALGDGRLTALDLRCLGAIASFDGMSLVKGKGAGCYAHHAIVAGVAGTDPTNFSKCLRRLVEFGYIAREQSRSDRRRRSLRVIYHEDGPSVNESDVVGEATTDPAILVGETNREIGRSSVVSGDDYSPLETILNYVETPRFANRELSQSAQGDEGAEDDEWALTFLKHGFALKDYLYPHYDELPAGEQLYALDLALDKIGREIGLLAPDEIKAYCEVLGKIWKNHAHQSPEWIRANRLLNELDPAFLDSLRAA